MRSSLIVAIRTGRRTTLCLAAVLLSLAVATRAADEAKQAAESSRKHALGQTVKNFELDDVSGKEVRLADFQDKSIIVLFSLGTECAISTAYLDELNQLQSRFSAQGLQVLGVDANAGATADEAAELYKKHEVRFPVLLDADPPPVAQDEGGYIDRIAVGMFTELAAARDRPAIIGAECLDLLDLRAQDQPGGGLHGIARPGREIGG